MGPAAKISRNRKLSIAWIVLAFCFFVSAAILIAVAVVFRGQFSVTRLDKHTLRSLTVGTMALTTATMLGIMIIVSLVIGIVGFCCGHGPGNGHKSHGLVAFNWSLICIMFATVIVGSLTWFFTLRERRDYMEVWLLQPDTTQSFLQDTLQCCGYFNASSNGFFTQATGFCSGITDATAVQGCVTPVTLYLLNNVFSTIYGFTAIQVSLFATTCCLIISRREEDRFRRIDEKNGGLSGGFV